MDKHTEQHERLLLELVAGDASLRDGPVASLLESCPECHAMWSELHGLQEDLSRAGALEEDVMGEARRLASAPGDEVAERDSERRVSRAREEYARRARPNPFRVLWPAAAALLVGVFFAIQQSGKEPDSDPFALGDDVPSALSPAGTVETFTAPFTWKLEAGDGGYFVVRVFDATSDEVLTTSPRLEGPTWTPESEEARGWPADIVWEVEAFDASGSAIGFAESSASRGVAEGGTR